ncbi:MAG: RidA family protein [Chloroflexi bacterium]|nr:RidA family protein [Chloroflexota bacterium]
MARVQTDQAPAAIGPYSQAFTAQGFVFCSGQVGIDPALGEFAGDSIEAQTQQALRNLQAVLEAAGSGLPQVVKTTVFLADMDDFQAMNAIYAEFFGQEPPARSTVAVKQLPLSARVEIEAVAIRASS